MTPATALPFGLSASHFAQPPVQQSKALEINGQNLIDAFNECGMAQCDKLALALKHGRHAEVGEMLEQIVQDWCKPVLIGSPKSPGDGEQKSTGQNRQAPGSSELDGR